MSLLDEYCRSDGDRLACANWLADCFKRSYTDFQPPTARSFQDPKERSLELEAYIEKFRSDHSTFALAERSPAALIA